MTETTARSAFRAGALAHRNFRLFIAGQGTSLIGTWMQSVALGTWCGLGLAFWIVGRRAHARAS